ncbi:helix-turn-helix domain-containing protein [Sanguibacter sp. 25GB23B1]|uniref:helix-turn-helix domain-containing protein n=1 Tax=unclassified Sanguibacter TaxID=2645534 RepID=UPI0032B0155A
MATDKPFLNVSETARLLGVHPNTVRNWVIAGTLVSSKPPGARQHRFAREEVMRMVERRSTSSASLAPLLRADEPELVTAMGLDGWASHIDAKSSFPELMRRLLALTPGITNLDIRAHEGVAAPGWDGSATSAGSAYLPAGELHFEFGTEKNSRRKAQEDYDKRVATLPRGQGGVFVYATPRNWAGARAWAVEQSAKRDFASVKAIDAHVLEGWLRETPAVHYWISERLGLHPRDAQTLARWWDSFQGRSKHALPAEFFTAGRAKEVDGLLAGLKSGGVDETIITVMAPWRDEALAFVYASLETQPALLRRAVIVTDAAAWDRLAASKQQMILVPQFEGADLKAAEDEGHRVVLAAGGEVPLRTARVIELPKVDRTSATEALRSSKIPSDKADSIVAMARRSVPAMLRSIARDPRAAPAWAQDPKTSSVLAPLVLASSWERLPGDGQIIQRLTGVPADEVERLLKLLAKRADPPFVLSGGLWRLASPAEAAFLLLRDIEQETLERWAQVVPSVLLEEAPLLEASPAEQIAASEKRLATTYSATLREHIAQGLALAASTAADLPGELKMRARLDAIVNRILEAASADETGATWVRLSQYLPSLAEASPEVFLDAIDDDLARQRPLLSAMFTDRDGDADFFGPSSPHPSLLWALETLCWAPEYFGRSSWLLSKLATIDPGGRLSNRPLGSLVNVTTGWIANSGATTQDKVEVIRRALERFPEVGWSLLLELWPGGHQFAFPPQRATFRDWAPATQAVTYADWGHFVHELVRLAVDGARDRAERWAQLVPNIDDVPPVERNVMIEALRGVATESEWTSEERYRVWEALSSEIGRHERHPDAAWALPTEQLEPLVNLAAKLEPSSDPRRLSNLFGWNPPVPGLSLDDDRFSEALSDLQRNAITDLLAHGVDQLELLIADVKAPHTIGWHLARMTDAPEGAVVAWLDSEVPNLREAALAYARCRILDDGMGWLRSIILVYQQLSVDALSSLMKAVPFSMDYWTEVDTLNEELVAAYWASVEPYGVPEVERREAAAKLLEKGRPWQAVNLVSGMLHSKQDPGVDLVKSALNGVLESNGPVEDRQMSGYNVEMLLEYLEETAATDPDLPQLEFWFFRLVPDHRPSAALYRSLGQDANQFVELIKLVFRREDEPRREASEQQKAHAGLAWSVLHEWSLLPGLRPDGTIDGEHLSTWVRDVRNALADVGRAAIGDEQIGQVLASSPQGRDGVWPAEEVRDIVDNLVNRRIETGLIIGRTNQRGVTTRGIYDGGDQERALENEYRDMAARIATRWPRTARLLRDIADNYQREASYNDADAERLGDQG